MSKTFSIKTLGCKLNQFESIKISEEFTTQGWKSVPFGKESDLVIINTCTVTDKSDKKCRNYIRQGAKFSRSNGVVVTGCLVDRDGKEVDHMPGVIGIFKNKDKDSLYKDITSLPQFKNNEITEPVIDSKGLASKYTRGLLKVQDGCDGKCTYCIIPTVRGLPESKNYNQVLDEAKKLVDDGYPEIVLTGITIGKYLSDGKPFSSLVKDMVNIPGDFRVRITSIEPGHLDEAFVELFAHEKVCNHIHLPIQSGSDKILKEMERPYDRSEYMDVVEKIYRVNPDIAIGTDIILGFPGESDEDFRESLSIISEVEYAYVHQFTYSRRSGTPAADFTNQCSPTVVTERSAILRELADGVEKKYKEKFLNKRLLSVIEKSKNSYSATADNYIRMKIENSREAPENLKGKIIPVELVSIGKDFCTGRFHL